MAMMAVITIVAGAAPSVNASSAPPTRWPLVPTPTGKLIIWAANTKAPITPSSGMRVSSNSRPARLTMSPTTGMLATSSAAHTGVAIDSKLLKKFDHLIGTRGYTNRSEAFRDLIRDMLVQQTWERPDSNVVGTVTLVYDHHVRLLNEKLTDLQHSHFHHILSTLHVHLDHDNCLEVLVVKGRVSAVKKIADALISTKGVKHGRLTITSTGAEL